MIGNTILLKTGIMFVLQISKKCGKRRIEESFYLNKD